MNHGYIPACIAAFSARESSCDSLSVAVSIVSCMPVHAISRSVLPTDFRCDLSPLTSDFSFSVFSPISLHRAHRIFRRDRPVSSDKYNDAITILRRSVTRDHVAI